MRRIIVLPFLAALGLLMLGGCTALLVGGAAAGGYAVGKDDRPPSQMLDDGAITASLKTKFAADKYVKAFAIDIDTYEGVVTLNGTVSSYVERTQAEKLASDQSGVKSVVNKLEIRKRE